MKLIYLANISLPNERAHSLQVMKMCEAFAHTGLPVELVVSHLNNKISPFVYYGLERNFTIRRIPGLGNAAHGKVSYWFNFISFSFLTNLYLLWVKISTNQLVVVYTRGEQILFLNFIAKFIWPVFWETHSKPDRLLKSYLNSANHARGIITVTDFYRRELKETYKVKPRVLWLPDGVTLAEMNIPLSQAEARQELGLPADKKIILYTGTFYVYDYKGIDVLLAAASLLPDDYLLVLVGGTQAEIKKIERENNLTNILLVSRIPHWQIAKYLCSADVFVLPNKKGDATSEKYTSPLKLFEYMAARRPIVSSDVGSLKEILDDSNAYIFKANDPRDLVRAVVQSLADKTEANKRIEKAFIQCQQYTWQKRAENILTFIKQELKK